MKAEQPKVAVRCIDTIRSVSSPARLARIGLRALRNRVTGYKQRLFRQVNEYSPEDSSRLPSPEFSKFLSKQENRPWTILPRTEGSSLQTCEGEV
jgi:hypothetical protein